MAPRGRAVELRVDGEDSSGFLVGQADARVADLKLHRDPGALRLVRACAHHDLARVRELDRVSDQVDQHLAQASRVSKDEVGHVRLRVEDELDAFVDGRLGEQLDRLLHHVARAELERFEPDPAGLDSREIEDVVDDLEQRVARRPNRLRVLPLLGCQLRVHQKASHTDHAAERCPDLVAHRGQELGLESRQLLQVLVALRQVREEH